MIKTFTKKLKLIASATLLCISSAGFSQIYWDFGTTSAYPASGIPANLAVDSLERGNPYGTPTSPLITTTSASGTYLGASGGGNAGTPADTGAIDVTPGGSAYFEVTLTPDAGYYVDITNISFGSRSTGTGPRRYSIRSSVDNFATEAAGDTILSPTSTWGLRTEALNITGAANTPVILRIYGYKGTGSVALGTTTFRIDDLNISATAVAVPVAVATADFSATTECFGTPTEFTDNSFSTAGPIVGWAWDFGDGSAPDLTQNPTHTYAMGGDFIVTLTVTDNMLNTDTYSDTIFVDSVGVTLSSSIAGNVVTFNSSASNGIAPYTYLLDFGDGSPAMPAPAATHTYTPGTYTACVMVFDANSCIDTACNTFTILATGISSNTTIEAGIYPNPSSNGIFTVDGISGKTTITVFNIIGKIVLSSEVNASGKHMVDLSSQADGSYFIRISNNDSVTTRKITIHK